MFSLSESSSSSSSESVSFITTILFDRKFSPACAVRMPIWWESGWSGFSKVGATKVVCGVFESKAMAGVRGSSVISVAWGNIKTSSIGNSGFEFDGTGAVFGVRGISVRFVDVDLCEIDGVASVKTVCKGFRFAQGRGESGTGLASGAIDDNEFFVQMVSKGLGPTVLDPSLFLLDGE
jgi:hypothetical protein